MSSAPSQQAIPASLFYQPLPRPRDATPETSAPPPADETPTHKGLASALPFSSLGGLLVETAFVEAASEVKGKFVLVSAEDFLEKHLPDHPGMPEVKSLTFSGVAQKKREVAMYEPMIDALKPFLKEGWSIVNTSNHSDPDSGFFGDHRIKPDLSVYSDKKPSNSNICRACDMETFLEFKYDPLDDGFGLSINELEKNSATARDTRGQLITYLNAMQAAQFRTHEFGVLVVGATCRLLRHTHSGIEVTSPFQYTSETYLQKFFWRLSHATPAVRGIDETFEKVHNSDASVFLKAPPHLLWKVRIGERYFYVSNPFTRSHHLPVGRGTRCFVALDPEKWQKCVLKDTWRVEEYHPEGKVYARLQASHVKNIPRILAEGDVSDSNGSVGSHSCGNFGSDSRWKIPCHSRIRCHTHYRIVLNVVGEPLTQFRSTYELTKCIYDALTAHFEAHTNASVDHRDISAGNIIIVRSDDGVVGHLIDWELSKYHEDASSRAYEKTGTLQFRAARLSGDQPVTRNIGDDLESFVLVFLWIVLRYASNKMTPAARAASLHTFDLPGSTYKESLLLLGHSLIGLYQLDSSPLRDMLEDLMDGYRYRYLAPRRRDPPNEMDLLQSKEKLETHGWMMNLMKAALKNDEWKAITDPAKDQEVAHAVQTKGKKRKSDVTEYEQVFAAKRRQLGERAPFEEHDDEDE